MHELFGWWTYQQWLAVLRIGVGLTVASVLGGLGWWAVDSVREAAERSQ